MIILLRARNLAHFMSVHLPLGIFPIVIFLCGIYVEVLFEKCVQGLKHYAYPSVALDVLFLGDAFRSTGFCCNTSRHQIEEGCFGCLFNISINILCIHSKYLWFAMLINSNIFFAFKNPLLKGLEEEIQISSSVLKEV